MVPGEGDDVARSFGVTFPEASLAPGSLGSFPAALSGTDPGRPGLGSAIIDAWQGGAPPTRVEVRAWDADHVRLTIRGPWWYADELRDGRGCSVERTLEADVWLPFGDAWDLHAPYASIDLPVQALCREAFATALEGAAQEFARLGPAGAAQAGALVQCAMTCAPRRAACEE